MNCWNWVSNAELITAAKSFMVHIPSIWIEAFKNDLQLKYFKDLNSNLNIVFQPCPMLNEATTLNIRTISITALSIMVRLIHKAKARLSITTLSVKQHSVRIKSHYAECPAFIVMLSVAFLLLCWVPLCRM